MADQDNSRVNALLENIASRQRATVLDSIKNEQGESIRALGAPTNNMLLSMINGELVQTNNMLLEAIKEMREQNRELVEQQKLMLQSIQDLASIMVHTSKSIPDNYSARVADTASKTRYYKSNILANKYDIYACILSHILSMIYVRMTVQSVGYPGSADCGFKELSKAVQAVSKVPCSISTVKFGDKIVLAEKSTAVIESIYPSISSSQKLSTHTLPESNLSKIYNGSTREDIFEHIYKLMDRLIYLHGILSPRQIEAIKSIKYPIVIEEDGEPLRLNIDEREWKGSRPHPVSTSILSLPDTGKKQYMALIMEGKSPPAAYGAVVEAIEAKKK